MTSADIVEAIQRYGLSFILTALTGAFTWYCKHVYNKIQEEKKRQLEEQKQKDEEHLALVVAVRSMLHDVLLKSLLYYLDKGEITVDEFDNVKVMFEGYRGLKGDGTIDLLWERFQKNVRVVSSAHIDVV